MGVPAYEFEREREKAEKETFPELSLGALHRYFVDQASGMQAGVCRRRYENAAVIVTEIADVCGGKERMLSKPRYEWAQRLILAVADTGPKRWLGDIPVLEMHRVVEFLNR